LAAAQLVRLGDLKNWLLYFSGWRDGRQCVGGIWQAGPTIQSAKSIA